MFKRITLLFLLLGLICVVLFAMTACERDANESNNSISKTTSENESNNSISEATSENESNNSISEAISTAVSPITSEQSEESTAQVVKILDETEYCDGKFTVKKTDENGTIKMSIWAGEKILYEYYDEFIYVEINGNDNHDRYLIDLYNNVSENFSVFDYNTNTSRNVNAHRSYALVDSQGNQYVPFGLYCMIWSTNSPFFATNPNLFDDNNPSYIINLNGKVVAGPFRSAQECSYNPCVFDISEKSGDKVITKSIYIDKTTGKVTEFKSRLGEDLKLYIDDMMKVIKPFYEAIKTNNKTAITAIIGKDRCDKAFSLVDTITDEFELYSANKDEFLAWFILNSKTLLKDDPKPDAARCIHLEGGFYTCISYKFVFDDYDVMMYITLTHDGSKFTLKDIDFVFDGRFLE